MRRLLIDCYDMLHAQSIDGVVWNVQEALKNWEARTMRDQVLWRKEGRIVALLTDRLGIDIERALDILYNSHTYALLINPNSGLQLQSDEYILTDLLRELEA